MSDIVKVAIISACAAALPSILGFVNNFHLKRLAATTEKLTEHTNGMQATIEKLAADKGFAAGEKSEREKGTN
jgi:hypothetical protein